MRSKFVPLALGVVIAILLSFLPIYPLWMEGRQFTEAGESLYQEWQFVSMHAYYEHAQYVRTAWFAPIDDPIMARYGGLKPYLSSWKSAASRLTHQPDGTPCSEQVAFALRIAPEDHEELIRNGEEFIAEWEKKKR